ncbi:cell division protein FtsL [Aliiglaciecola sp. CAU 1673]|uniref:cell division protein FtsL n=1 Tax=Aliiglaciecola sp. CAU 1673 TaxID=3032595 RepID=UPI0023D9FD84|nr:cell division protein FtsL [Aliiglaciecola sp. CAU 1673]MDF2178439.1 cell division protein FtsL [Aliiglaciecola sp. CAU 1673]
MKDGQTQFNLVVLLWTDLTRHLGRVLLYLMVLTSAGAVILSAHHNRQLTIVHEQLMQERDQLDVEWRHLVLEQSALTEHNRLESMVQKQLSMRRPLPQDEVVVQIK